MYWPCAEALVFAARLGVGQDLPPPAQLRGELLDVLRQMVARCRAAGLNDADTVEARYALVAFMDERVLKSNWAGRTEWMKRPLQLELYREFAAGENFFLRMRPLLQRQPTPASLEIYYLCLALGFEGVTSGGGGAENAQSFLAAARAKLAAGAGDSAAALSPRGLASDGPARTAPRRSLLLLFAASCALVVLAGLGLLGWSLDNTIQGSLSDLDTAAHLPAPRKR
jgi:type VI secretion system protein ImpK